MIINLGSGPQKSVRLQRNGHNLSSAEAKLEINRDGQVQLPEEVIKEWGLVPGTNFLMRYTSNGELVLRKADIDLTRIYVEPTNACNLNCRICVRRSWEEPEGYMKMEDYKKLIEGLKSINTVQKISFWGFGEPTLHPNLAEMIFSASQLGISTEIITNALNLDKNKSKKLIEAGLQTLIVSVDGALPQTYSEVRSDANLDKVKQNLVQLKEQRLRAGQNNPEIGIEFVVMRKNYHELRYLRQLAYELGASFIFLTNVLPYSEEMKNEILYRVSTGLSVQSALNTETPWQKKSDRWQPEIFIPPIDFDRKQMEPILALTDYPFSVWSPQMPVGLGEKYCRFVNEGSIVVSWDGEVSPCIALMHSYDCYIMDRKKHIQRYTLGNIGREGVADIWAKKEFADFRERIQEFPFSLCTECGGCDLAETNQEDCFGNTTFPVCGDCLWATGVIQCP